MEILKRSIIIIFVLLGLNANAQSLQEAFIKSYKYESEAKYDDAAKEILKHYDKSSYVINLRLGWLMYMAEQYDKSSQYYQLSIKQKPLSIEALLGKTYPESVLGNWDNVISLYKEVLQIAPNNYTANLKLAQIYLNTKKYSDADKYVKLILSQYPFNFDVLIVAAWNNYYLGKLREAKILFNNALLLYPNNESATEGLSKIK